MEFQDHSWGIFAVIPGYPRRANGDSQHLEARPVLQDWLRFELFTVKNYRTRHLNLGTPRPVFTPMCV